MIKKAKLKSVIVLILLVYVAYSFVRLEVSINRKKNELNSYKQKVTELQDKNLQLKDEVNLSKDPDYMEKQAREKCGLVKVGETPVINTNTK